MPKRQYVTTAIDYPNAAPHMGHVLEKVLADVVARWFRLRGDSVRFQIGTDEHGVKIQQTASKQGMTPAELVDRNVPMFQELYSTLCISADVFIRTTDQKRHWPTVQALWKKLQEAHALEKRTYTGLYCAGCERFVTKKDLVDGKCPDHNVAPQEVKEENWFFLLKNREAALKKLLTEKDGYTIIPSFRAPETLNLLEHGLEDVSFSRPQSSLSWGIPVPDDERQTMYVWCDALTNYISGVGLLTDHAEEEWWNDATVTHVIGKDIARFHALIWPAMLQYAGIKTPDQLLIHGFLTSEGQKMSKSIGNVVAPEEVLAHFNGNPDPLRFYLSHEIPVGNDGDFSWKRIDEIYDSKLRNQVGNLLNRVLLLLKKKSEGTLVQPIPAACSFKGMVENTWGTYAENMADFALHQAMQKGPLSLVEQCNVWMQTAQPWKETNEAAAAMLSEVVETLRHVVLMLLPFIPQTAQRIARQLNLPYAEKMLSKDFVITEQMKEWGSEKAWTKVGEPEILFAPLEK